MTNKVWFHAGAPCNGCTGIGEMWQQLEAAGIPFGVYSVDGGGLVAVDALKFRMAQTLIYRSTRYDYVPYHVEATAEAAASYWAEIAAALPAEVRAAKDRVWIEVFNEPDKERPEIVARWQFQLAQAALADGYRFCGPGWASGTPEPEAWRGEWMRRYLRLCAAEPERVAVTLHEYSYDAADIRASYPYLIGRYKFLFEACDALGIARPAVFITETGWTLNDMPAATEDAMADVAWLAQEYAGQPQIKAAFLWTLLGGGDKKQLAQRLNGLMGPLTDYALTTRFDEGTTPPAPTPRPEPVPTPTPTPTPDPTPAAGNLLTNGDFGGGWSDSADWPMTTQDPKGWLALWNASQGDDYRNDYAPDQPYRIGEAVHKNRAMVPAAEHADFFATDHDWTYKVFAASRPFWFRLKTRPALELPAGRYTFAFQVFTDTYHWQGRKVYEGIERHHTQTMVKVNGRVVRDWTALPAGLAHEVATTFDHDGGPVELALHLRCNWGIASNNLWLKDARLTAVAAPQPPTPAPEPEPVPVPTPEPQPPTPAPLLLDISKWQGSLDAARLKAAGVDGVMLRASYASNTGSRPDEKADEFATQLAAAGIPFGWYHYFHPTRPASEQFAAFRGVVERHGYKLPLALDLEEREGESAITAARAHEFLTLMGAAFPIQGKHLIYTSLGYWRDALYSPAWGVEYGLWIAAWTTADRPAVPAPWTRWTLWQYANDGNGPAFGVGSARVDLDRFNGTAADFAAWVIPTPPVEPPPAETLTAALWARSQAEPSLTWNPTFALAAAILADDYHVVSAEYDLTYGGQAYRAQNAADDGGRRRVYYCRVPEWPAVRWIASPGALPSPVPEPSPSAKKVDLSRAFRPIRNGGGESYGPFLVYRHDDGRTEDAQYLVRGEDVYLIKGTNYEHLRVTAGGIWRYEDTSHSATTYYTLRDEGATGHRWLPRVMTLGEVFRREPVVTIARKADCGVVSSGRHVTWALAKALIPSATLGGHTVRNVVDLYVANTADVANGWFERYWYALGSESQDGRADVRGLVQWWARNDKGEVIAHSVLADVPQGRAPLPLLKPKCIDNTLGAGR